MSQPGSAAAARTSLRKLGYGLIPQRFAAYRDVPSLTEHERPGIALNPVTDSREDQKNGAAYFGVK